MSNKNQKTSSSWGVAETIGYGVIAALGLGAAYLAGKSQAQVETPRSMNSCSSSSQASGRQTQCQPKSKPYSGQPGTCAICLNDFGVVKLRCGHYYDKKCIDSWKRTCIANDKTPTCPSCLAVLE